MKAKVMYLFNCIDDCQWVHQIEATEMGRIIWDRMKPMVQGYILFTPDTKATRRIMKEVF